MIITDEKSPVRVSHRESLKKHSGVEENMKKKIVISILLILINICVPLMQVQADVDQRQYAHGINFLTNPVTEKSYLIWSDAYSRGVTDDGDWTHNVFFQRVKINKPLISRKKTLIKAKEAQEPASASVAGDGSFIVSFEDGYKAGDYGVCQRYAIYNKNMKVIKKYPQLISMGGHSGHCASTQNRHVVFWCEDWVDGGGVDDLGSGKNVYVTTMTTKGKNITQIPVSVGDDTRDWWPIAAASSSKVFLLWQRFVPGETYSNLCYALLDPVENQLLSIPDAQEQQDSCIQVMSNIKAAYYTYQVSYLESTNQFLVAVTSQDQTGTLLLFSDQGTLLQEIDNLPAFVREATPAIKEDSGTIQLCYPQSPSGAFTVTVNNNQISLASLSEGSYNWSYQGTCGFYDSNGEAYFYTLGETKRYLIGPF